MHGIVIYVWRDFHRSKYLYKLQRSDVSKTNLKEKSNFYNETMRSFYNMSRLQNISKLRDLETHDPRR